MENNVNVKNCVSAIIMNKNGEVLVQDHVKLDAITLPGGKIDPNEKTEFAFIREMFEELGILPFRYKKVMTADCGMLEYPAHSNEYFKFTQTYFIITEYKGNIENKEPEKHKALLWLKPSELASENRKTSKSIKIFLENIEKFSL